MFFLSFFQNSFCILFLRKTSTEENVRKRTDGAEGGTAGSALRGNYACAGMERCAPNGEQDGGRWKNCPDKKKAPPCGGKAFLNEKKLRMRRRTEPLAGRGTPVGDFRLRPTLLHPSL